VLACALPLAVAAQPLDCLIQPGQVVQVGAPVSGVLEGVDVDRGDTVRRGQVVARLESAVERAQAQLAQSRAAQTAELQAAERGREFARRESTRARDLAGEEFLSKAAADKAETDARVSEDRVQQASERRRQAEQELRVAEAQLARRQVRSPIGGIVVERYMSAGELAEDRPILRIAEVHPLRVEVVVPAPAFGLVASGRQATVRPDSGPVREATGTVTIVDRVLDPASNTFRVRLTLPNADMRIPAGSRCKVDLGLDAAAAQRPAVSVPAVKPVGGRGAPAVPAPHRRAAETHRVRAPKSGPSAPATLAAIPRR
jgi:RND family efflux transporter MFP subunit